MRIKLDKRTLAFIFIFLIGLSILLYPVVSSTWNQMLANHTINRYDEVVELNDPSDIEEQLRKAREYNSQILPKSVPDAFAVRSETTDLEYESLLNPVSDGLMGYIKIPAINVKSPIYHYTTDDALNKGVGHLFGSSLPVGGKGSHSVLSAHRGLPHNRLFSDLDKVVVGDRFFLHIYNEVFAYEIDNIEIVLPDQTQGLAQIEGKDYVTLVTCTPYGVNTHRILCRGHRVPYVPGEEDKISARNWLNMNIVIGLVGALLGILLSLIVAIRLKKRNKETEIEQEESEEKSEKRTIHIR